MRALNLANIFNAQLLLNAQVTLIIIEDEMIKLLDIENFQRKYRWQKTWMLNRSEFCLAAHAHQKSGMALLG